MFRRGGGGFLRLSCAEPDDRLCAAVAFIGEAVTRGERVASYLESHPEYRLAAPYGDD